MRGSSPRSSWLNAIVVPVERDDLQSRIYWRTQGFMHIEGRDQRLSFL